MKTFLKYALLLIISIIGFTAIRDIQRSDTEVSSDAAKETLVSTEAEVEAEEADVPLDENTAERESDNGLSMVATAKEGPSATDGDAVPVLNESTSSAIDAMAPEERDGSLRVVSSVAGSVNMESSPENDDSTSNEPHKKNASRIDARKAILETLSAMNNQKGERAKSSPLVQEAAEILEKEDFERNASDETNDRLAKTLGLRMRSGRDSVTIGAVSRSGAAYRAGIRPGDTVISVNREPVLGTEELRSVISEFTAGDSLELFVVRGEEWRSFTITVPEE